MSYESIEEIRAEFNLQATTLDGMRKELRKLQRDLHPDKNNGSFRSDEEKSVYLQLEDALSLIDEEKQKGTALVTKSEFDEFLSVVRTWAPKAKEVEREKEFSGKIEDDILVFRSRHQLLKIVTAVVSVLLSVLWLFPEAIQRHAVLSKYIGPDQPLFTTIWMAVLFVTAIYWLATTLRENREEEHKRKLKVESVQNELFRRFLRYKQVERTQKKRSSVVFAKEEYVNYLTAKDRFDFSDPSVMQALKREMFLRKKVGRVGLELAQSLADITIQRALTKGLIKKEISKSLSDTYSFLPKDLDLG